jgi:ABC-type uncharacterized transport system involved in gliding motility auxiliary subunit
MEIMKGKLQKFSKIGLVVAAVGMFASLALGLILKKFNLPVQISLGLGVIGFAAFIIFDPDNVRRFIKGRQARHGTNAFLLILAVLGILIIVNLLSYKNTIQWDLTEDKDNTLAEETVNTLNSLASPIHAQAFFSSNLSTETATTLLEKLKTGANGNFDFEFIDPNLEPVLAKNAGIVRDGSIVLKMEERQEIITTITEVQVTSALLRLSQPGVRSIYFLTGHGERSILESSEFSYTNAVAELKTKNYQINELNLIATNSIPEDALAIIIAGPAKPLSALEVQLIKEYQTAGGSLIVLYEPSLLTEFSGLEDPLQIYLSESWSIQINDDFVIDTTATNDMNAIITSFSEHPISESLTMVAIFPSARSVSINDLGTNTANSLAFTSENSWAETDMNSLLQGNYEFTSGVDIAGPVSLAVISEDTASGSRIVVFGDVDFANDSNYSYYGNADLFLNSVDWVANQDSLINLTPRTKTTRVVATPQLYVQGLIMFGSIILLPASIILAAIIVFVRRKREI